jgi:hypothetical protein
MKPEVSPFDTGWRNRLHTHHGDGYPMPRSAAFAPMFSSHPPRKQTMNSQPVPAAEHSTTVRPDTRAWRIQVWVSFGVAVALAGTGLAWLPGDDLDRAFMFMAYLFCMSAAFVVAKHVRDQESAGERAAPMWGGVVWGGFALAMALTAWGLFRMDINPTWKAYLGVCWLFLISTVFTLAKTLRDAHEALVSRLRAEARAERL